MSTKMNILIIDDDPVLTRLINRYLSGFEFNVLIEHSGLHAVSRIIKEKPDLVILDLMLPEIDGFTICKNVRDRYNGPILMLTARDQDDDEIEGLSLGADDYICKPVKPPVLLAHIRALLRRTQVEAGSSQPQQVETRELMINNARRTVRKFGSIITLTTSEFELLWLLALQVGTPVSRDQLHMLTFQIPYDGVDRSIDLRVSRLRKKLEDDPKIPKIIKTVRNIGYVLSP
ncbi:MAG: response regulator [bacterium]